MTYEMSSNSIAADVNSNSTQKDLLYPYLMQYQFTGSSMTPSFSSVQQVPVDIRFTKYWVGRPNHRGDDPFANATLRHYLQIRAAWESYPLEKRNFRERHFYHRASFGFYRLKANKNIYKVPDFSIQLSKATVVLKKDFAKGVFADPNQFSGEISFEYQHRHCHGTFPPHLIEFTHSPEEPWGLFP